MDDPVLLDLLAGLFFVGTVLVVLKGLLPHLMPALGLDCFRAGAWGGPSDLDPDDKHESYAPLYHKLLVLGFEPLGVTWEKVVGKPRFVSYAFVLRKENCRASLTPLLGGDFRVLLASLFTDGSAVLTTNYARPTERTADYRACGVPTQQLELVLDEHRRAVAQLAAEGHTLQECQTLDDIVEAKRVYHFNPSVRRTYRQNTAKTSRALAVFFGGLPAAVLVVALLEDGWRRTMLCLAALLVAFLLTVRWQELRQEKTQALTRHQQAADAARRRRRLV